MYDLDKAYPKKFFSQRGSLHWRVKIVCEGIYKVLEPSSVIDFGCGNGDLLSWFYVNNIPIFGIEGTGNCEEFMKIPDDLYQILDLRKPIYGHRKYDLALCLEVAEHLESDYAYTLVKSICKASRRVIFTAAGPGQGGRHHVNLQYKPYWIELFLLQGFIRNTHIENALMYQWQAKKNVKGVKAYYQNLIYFEQKLNIVK